MIQLTSEVIFLIFFGSFTGTYVINFLTSFPSKNTFLETLKRNDTELNRAIERIDGELVTIRHNQDKHWPVVATYEDYKKSIKSKKK